MYYKIVLNDVIDIQVYKFNIKCILDSRNIIFLSFIK